LASYAAFLRGINVGGHKATKDQLARAFEGCGFGKVSTFRASGNVLFEAPGSPKPGASEMEAALEDELGYAVPVFIRSASQLEKVVALGPFSAKELKASKGKLQVAFLPKKPAQGKSREALSLATDEPLAIHGSELYWLPKAGMLESELDLRALEKLLGPWTMRTMGTVEQIASKLGKAGPEAMSRGKR
jgi:uncharacterized protein (DUF1697 family)